MNTDPLLDELLAEGDHAADHALAARYAPIIAFDEREPFLPLAAGYTIFRADGPSPSFPRELRLAEPGAPPASLAIEYAIWWDWDIGHLYELEHVWVFLDESGAVVRCEASAHGGFAPIRRGAAVELDGERAVVYAEPGKHAFAADPSGHPPSQAPNRRSSTLGLAGVGGVLVTPLFAGRIARTPQADTLARTYLARLAFEPSYRFSQRFSFAPQQLVPWPALQPWIPRRVAWWVARLAREIAPHEYRPLRIGHRGAAGHAPDNSLAGVEAAARLGADAVEIDARRTRDGVAVAAHDEHWRAAPGQALPIGAATLAELRAATPPGHAPLATLDEILDRCAALRLGLYLELKEPAAIDPALACVAAHDYADTTIVASFRPDWLADARASAPQIAGAVLFSSPAIEPVALAAACGASFVHPCWERRSQRPDQVLTPDWLEQVRAAGLGIVTWHEERPEVIAGLRARGVDAICSDRPELLGDAR